MKSPRRAGDSGSTVGGRKAAAAETLPPPAAALGQPGAAGYPPDDLATEGDAEEEHAPELARRVAAILDDAAEPSAAELADGSPYLLDYLRDLSPTDPLRVGLRFKVWRIPGPGRRPELLPLAWEPDVPTEELLAGMVQSGELQPGSFRVVVRKGRRTLPTIAFDVAAPVGGSALAPAGAGPLGAVLPLLSALGVGRQAADGCAKCAELARDLERESEAREELAAHVARLTEAVNRLNELAAQLAAGGDAPRPGLDLTELGKEAVRTFLGNRAGPVNGAHPAVPAGVAP